TLDDNTNNASYQVRRENAARAYGQALGNADGFAQDTYRQVYQRTLIVNMGREIELIHQEIMSKTEVVNANESSVGFATQYVPRARYDSAFASALRSEKRIVAFAGPPGVGKT